LQKILFMIEFRLEVYSSACLVPSGRSIFQEQGFLKPSQQLLVK
jgi:hypothetical protein